MRDIDEILRADAQRWQARSPEPPDFTAALETAVGTTVSRYHSWRLPVAVAATVALVVGAVTLALNLGRTSSSHEQQRQGPASIVVNGKTIPYAGVVPWAGPISYASDRSVVYVYADNDQIHGVADVCGVDADRARVVEETNSLITIRVSGFAFPLPEGVACAGVGLPPVPVAVHLSAPLAGRTLIDAIDGKSHRVLDAATIPMPHFVPAACTPHPLEWNDTAGIVFREWAANPNTEGVVELLYGPKRAIDRIRRPHGVPGTVSIGDTIAHTWRSGSLSVVFEWSPRPGFKLRLSIYANTAHPFTTEEQLAIARSVH